MSTIGKKTQTIDLPKHSHFAQPIEQLPMKIYMFHILPLSNSKPIHILFDSKGISYYLKDANWDQNTI